MKNKKKYILISIISIVLAIIVSAIIVIYKASQLNIGISSNLINVKADTVVTEIKAKSAKAFLNSKLNVSNVIETDDSGYLVVGNLKQETIDLGNNIKISNDVSYIKAMIIKYDSNWNAQWAHTLDRNSNSGGVFCGDDSIEVAIQTKDGGYVVGGYFKSHVIYPDPKHISVNTSLKNADSTRGTSIADGMIIKYDKSGNYEWSKRYGSSGKNDKIKSIIKNKDESFFIVGTMDKNDFIIKYDSSGNEQWSKTLSGDGTNLVSTIIETKDGGYLLGGSFSSTSIKLSDEITLQPIQDSLTRSSGMIIKFDSSGIVQWADSISGNRYDSVKSIIGTEDGGYIVAGETSSQTLKGQQNHGYNTTYDYNDWFFIKYNIIGNVEWTNLIGENKSDYFHEAIGTEDGGYIVIGSINYNELIIKYDSSANEQWRRTINLDNIYSILQTEDNGYIVTGQNSASNVDLGNNVNINNNGNEDVVIIKYDSLGNAQWAKVIGGTESEKMNLIAETRFGGYLLLVKSYSLNINLENNISINETTSGWKDIIIKYESTIDKIPPIIKVNPQNGEYAKSRNITITITDEGDSGLNSNNNYQYYLSTSSSSLTGGEWTNYTPGEEFTIGEGKTGTYYLFVKRVVDNAGNTSKEAGSIQQIGEEEYQKFGPYKFDNTLPIAGTMTMKIGSSTGSLYTNETWTNQSVYIEPVNGLDEHSGHNTTTYSVSGAITLDNQTASRTLSSKGIYTITVTTTDNVGNVAEKIYTVKIDKTLPIITVTPNNGTDAKTRNITITITDEAGLNSNNNYQYYLSTSSSSLTGGEWTNYTPGEEFIMGEGKTGRYYLFIKRVRDNAGNISTSTGYSVTIGGEIYQRFGPYDFDNTPPTAGTLTMKLENYSGTIYIDNTWTSKSVYITLTSRL